MAYQKTFDELFQALLTDWQNQYPEADVSQGSLIFMKSACMASALWGMYKYQDWISAQVFPDTADTEFLEHHAWVRGLSRNVGETDAALLTRLLDYIRRPPAGGNKYDFIKWAMQNAYVARAFCFPMGQGLGTVDVLILANATITGSEIPSSHALTGTVTDVSENKLVDDVADFTDAANPVRVGDVAINDVTSLRATVTSVSATELGLDADIFTVENQAYTLKSLAVQVKEYIDSVRPAAAKVIRVLPPTVIEQDVTMTVTGTGINTTAIAADITAYINGLGPGEPLYVSRLIAVAIAAGAANDVISEPVADVTVTEYEIVRPGTVSVTQGA